ncbi:hypothetical protein O1L60_22090 [Streptomyces diastatochromogenes]|nr:hypothetical protein [Streptomyces diastatochromogenes]
MPTIAPSRPSARPRASGSWDQASSTPAVTAVTSTVNGSVTMSRARVRDRSSA